MPLPVEGSPWLPRHWAPAFDRYRFDEAIWLNDTETLSKMLTGGSVNSSESRTQAELSKRRGILVNLMRRWGWAKIGSTTEKRTDLPVPIGASIADLSAAQLMSEAPMFRALNAEGKVLKKTVTQDRLDLLANSDDAHMTFLEGGTIAAAISGVILKAVWDKSDPDRESAWFDVVGADCAIPEFNAAGRLVGVMLWQEYPGPGNAILRHFEYHRPGGIEHAVYRGTSVSVGKQVKIDTIPELAAILSMAEIVTTGFVVVMPTGMERLTAQYWKNRNTRAMRRQGVLANLGRSDFDLIEPLIDQYSEAWGSMMRDVRLGKARAFVPQGTLELLNGTGGGGAFDPDREFYQEVAGLNPDAGAENIKVEQPDIRWQEHMQVLAGLKLEILDGAGWSLSSYGNSSGVASNSGAVTATEVVDRTTKSERTRDTKALFFAQAAQPFFRMLLELDATLYGTGAGIKPGESLSIEFPDISQVDPEKQARTFLDLSTARAISIEQTVRERKPNWDDDEVADEVNRILADIDRLGGSADPITLGRAPGDDAPTPDEQDALNPPPAPPKEPEPVK